MARSIPDEVVRHVRVTARFSRVAQHLGYTLKRRGSRDFIVCPFHQDSSDDGGSCMLNESEQSMGEPNWFKCFGCGASGSIFTFWCRHHGWPTTGKWFQRAVREIAAVFGVADMVPTTDGRDDTASRIRKRLQACERQLLNPAVISVPEVDDAAGCERWSLRSSRCEQLPEGLIGKPTPAEEDEDLFADPGDEPLVYIPLVPKGENVRYPLQVLIVAPLEVACVVERDGWRVRGILTTADDVDRVGSWSVVSNRPESLSPNGNGALRLISARIGVESPLDYLRLNFAGYPCAWGVWGLRPGEALTGPLQAIPTMTIPQITAVHTGKGGVRRLRRALHESQNWLPREIRLRCPDLQSLGAEELAAALDGWPEAPILAPPA